MNTRLEIARIAGIPVYHDLGFEMVAALLSSPYFTSGDSNMVSIGIVYVIGLLLSILLHELGHAFAGRMFGQQVAEIELNGFGGLCKFERSLPRSVVLRTIVFLAGPAMNLLLWYGLDALADAPGIADKPLLARALANIAYANMFLLFFNLLPAYPLDGGQTLDAWLGPILGPAWSVRIVAGLGLLVAAFLVFVAFPRAIFMLLVALSIGLVNWEALKSVGGFTGRR
jgi:Zn-dependent protease